MWIEIMVLPVLIPTLAVICFVGIAAYIIRNNTKTLLATKDAEIARLKDELKSVKAEHEKIKAKLEEIAASEE